MTKRTRQTKEQTSKNIWDAIYLIEDGTANNLPEPDCKVVSIKNVCLQANVSRPTLYSYPDIKEYISEQYALAKNETTILHSKIKNLSTENEELKEYIKQVEAERDAALLIQYNTIEKLKVKNNLKIVK